MRRLLAKRRPGGLLTMWAATPVETAPVLERVPPASDPDVRCLLTLGAALLGYGLPAHRVEEAVLRLSRAFGLESSVFGLPTVLMVTVRRRGEPQAAADTSMVRADPGTIDLARLDALHRLVASVERGELDAHAAEQRARAILSAPRAVPRLLDLIAVAFVAFGGVLMLGGDLRAAGWSALLGLGTGGFLWASATRPGFARVLPVVAAVAITVGSCALAHAGLLSHPLMAAFAALFVLLPGLTLTLAMTELATGHLVSGTSRSMGALAVFLQLGLGVLLGVRLGRLHDASVVTDLAPATLGMASGGALLLAVGFTVLLTIRRGDLPATLGVCALSFLLCRAAGAWLGVESGVLLAAAAVGLVSHVFARRYDRPSSTLTLPGVVMLVPGSLGLISVSAAALRDPTRAFEMGFQMLLVVAALSTGILLSAAALPPRSDL